MPLNPEFAVNPDPRCACVLLLDTSTSMQGAPISALNEGLHAFQSDIQEDSLAKRRVEVAVVTFGEKVTTVQPFVSAGNFVAPQLVAEGSTPMGEAIATAVQLVKARKDEYKAHGIAYYQPWIVMITDGEPTDEWKSAAQLVQAESLGKQLTFFAVGVADANLQTLASITPRVVKLDGLKFRDLFIWLSQSQKKVSASKVGDQTALPQVTFASPV